MKNKKLQIAARTLAAFWIFAMAFAFFVRFSGAFYFANKSAIDKAITKFLSD